MALITQLPEEVIYTIVENDCISIADIVRFSSTCKRFQNMLHLEHSEESHWNNKFWEKKFFQRCYTTRKKYYIKKQNKIFQSLIFKKLIQEGIKCIKKLQNYVFLMSDDKLLDANKKELQHFLYSVAEKSTTYYFVLDELNRIISAQVPGQLGFKYDLTNTYNLCLILHCIKQIRFVYKSSKFACLPKEKQILEKFVTIVVQYFEPHITYSVIKTWLNDIAQDVLKRLKNKYPAHSICSTSAKHFSVWENNNIDDTFWSPTEAKQIMDELKTFVFYNVQYIRKILYQLMMTLDLKDKYIKKFTGLFEQYLMVIICHCITRRLGISSGLRQLFLPDADYSNQVVAFWIPLGKNRGNAQELIYPSIVEERIYSYYPSMNLIKIVDEELMRVCYGQRDSDTINKYIFHFLSKDILFFFYYDKFYYNNNGFMNPNVIDNLYKCCTRLIKIAEEKPLQIRKKEMKFAVGMIVTHSCKFYSTCNSKNYYKQDGVIIEWYHKCNRKMENASMFPYLEFLTDNYHFCFCKSNKQDQPHYIILTENDKICYVREDKLSRCAPKEINNIEIGHFFSKFEGNYYVPTKRLAKRYPNDSAAILQILGN